MTKAERIRAQILADVEKKLKLERIVSREIKSLFKRIRDDFRIGMAAGRQIDARKYKPEWKSLLEKHYKRTQNMFLGSVISFNEAKAFQFKQAEEQEEEDTAAALLLLALLSYRELRSAEQAEYITGTTSRNIAASIMEANRIAAQEELDRGPRPMAALASTILSRKFLGRVEGIATLETQAPAEAVKLSEAQSLTSLSDSEKDSTKQWWTVGDRVVRPTHKSANRKLVGIDQNFTIGGSLMRHPGDSSLGAPLREIANCRCSVIYTVF